MRNEISQGSPNASQNHLDTLLSGVAGAAGNVADLPHGQVKISRYGGKISAGIDGGTDLGVSRRSLVGLH
jgi:hypothetical protein